MCGGAPIASPERTMVTIIRPQGHTPTPSVARQEARTVAVADAVPAATSVLGVPVLKGTAPPAAVGLDSARLEAAGFDASIGSTAVLPGDEGPVVVAVGLGEAGKLDVAGLRLAAAAFARAASTHAELAISMSGIEGLDAQDAAQALVEGMVLARYSYDPLRGDPTATPLEAITLVTEDESAVIGAERGRVFASATEVARDLANSPHSHLSAVRLADLAAELGPSRGLAIDIFDKDDLIELGCGGLLGVNAGSVEPPRMIKMSYTPAGEPSANLAIVGKGIMYDSGGLSLKPGDEVHAQMKNDMSGAAATFAAMVALADSGCEVAVTAYLMCTDNMPSGTAMALGDVLTIRGGKTVEVINTDAEGRLVMADALVLAVESGVDAVVDIATLTGACMRALGTHVAGVFGNDDALVGQVQHAAARTDEPVWHLPLESAYRTQLDSPIADLRNLGGANAGAITAALFLSEFVGDVPWAHIDIAGTAQSTGDAGWQTAGCTGFGARLLIQLAHDFEPTRH